MRKILEKLLSGAQSSDCPRAQCCAYAITNDDIPDEVIGINYHIMSKECVIEEGHCVSAIHAEVDMVAQAARRGINLQYATVYSLQRPCQRCLMTMYCAGVVKVWYFKDYHSKAHGEEYVSPELMKKLEVQQYTDPEETNQVTTWVLCLILSKKPPTCSDYTKLLSLTESKREH